MFKALNILDESDKRLRLKNKDVVFPLSDSRKKLIKRMLDELRYSQIPELSEKYDLRPGMGLAAPQLGINENFFVIVYEYDEGKFEDYVIFNPKIISHSESMVCAASGEGCLSVNRDVDGVVPRYERVTVEGFDIDGKPIKIRAREELAIAFQHEYDHLQGILFFDKIDKDDPYQTKTNIKMI